MSDAITGTPSESASATGSPKPSTLDGATTAVAPRTSDAKPASLRPDASTKKGASPRDRSRTSMTFSFSQPRWPTSTSRVSPAQDFHQAAPYRKKKQHVLSWLDRADVHEIRHRCMWRVEFALVQEPIGNAERYDFDRRRRNFVCIQIRGHGSRGVVRVDDDA